MTRDPLDVTPGGQIRQQLAVIRDVWDETLDPRLLGGVGQ